MVVTGALSDRRAPAYDEALAGKLAGKGNLAFTSTPPLLPELIEAELKVYVHLP